MRRANRNPSFLITIAAFGMLVVSSISAERRLVALSRATARVEETHGVLTLLGRIPAAIAEAEGGLRAYVLTGEPSFVATLDTAAAASARLMDELALATAEHPPLRQRVVALAPLVARRFALLRAGRALRARGPLAPGEYEGRVLAGRALSDSVRTMIVSIGADEESLLVVRRAQEAAAVAKTRRLVRTSLAVATVLGVASVASWLLGVRRRRRAEAALRDSEARMRNAMEYSAIGLALVRLDGRYILVNPALCRIVGYEATELRALTFQEITHSDDLEADLEYVRRLVAGEIEWYEMEKRYVRKNGTVVPVLLTASLVRSETGEPVHFISQVQDITERKRLEAEVRASEQKFRAVTEAAQDAIVAADPHGTITFWNPAAERLFGYPADEAVGQNLTLVMPERAREEHLAAIRRAAAPGGPTAGHTIEGVGRRKDGSEFPLEMAIGVWAMNGQQRYSAVIRDITARKRQEAEERRIEALEAVGRIAGAVAHGLNNLLTSVSLGVDELAVPDTAVEVRREALGQIREATDRAAALVQQLLAAGERQLLQPRVVDLLPALEEWRQALQPRLPAGITLEASVADSAAGGAWVRIDPDAYRQVFADLLARLQPLMGASAGARLSLGVVELPEPRRGERGDVPVGKYVCVELRVTGLSAGRRSFDRVLEPFATQDGGTESAPALGLAPVLGLLHQSGCHLSIERPAPGAANFAVLSPELEAPVAATPAAEPVVLTAVPTTPVVVLANRVLVVEDEDSVRRAVARFLERLGYDVAVAEHGVEAARYLDEHRAELPALVLTDLVMPELGGRELGELVQARYPAARMLYMTGYTADEVFRQQLLDPALPLLHKPFSLPELVAAVEGALGRPAPRRPAGLARPTPS